MDRPAAASTTKSQSFAGRESFPSALSGKAAAADLGFDSSDCRVVVARNTQMITEGATNRLPETYVWAG